MFHVRIVCIVGARARSGRVSLRADMSRSRGGEGYGDETTESLLLHLLGCGSEDELYRTLSQLLLELQRPPQDMASEATVDEDDTSSGARG
jgi:hypothetical protein